MEVEEAREALHRRLEEVQTLEEEVGRCRKSRLRGGEQRLGGWNAYVSLGNCSGPLSVVCTLLGTAGTHWWLEG